MRYTQSQIRDLLGVSVDAFRVWRDAVPALSAHRGHGPTFTPGEVVAMAVLAELVRDFGLRVGLMGDRLDALFNACRGQSWLSLSGCIIVLSADQARLVDVAAPRGSIQVGAHIVIACAPIVDRLQSALTATAADEVQGRLHFPPTALAAAARSGDRV
jgi:hypothetical protein